MKKLMLALLILPRLARAAPQSSDDAQKLIGLLQGQIVTCFYYPNPSSVNESYVSVYAVPSATGGQVLALSTGSPEGQGGENLPITNVMVLGSIAVSITYGAHDENHLSFDNNLPNGGRASADLSLDHASLHYYAGCTIKLPSDCHGEDCFE